MSHGRRSLVGRKGGHVAIRITAPYHRHGRNARQDRLFLEEEVWRWRECSNPQPRVPPMLGRFRTEGDRARAERLQSRLMDLIRSLPRFLRPAQRARLARRRARRR